MKKWTEIWTEITFSSREKVIEVPFTFVNRISYEMWSKFRSWTWTERELNWKSSVPTILCIWKYVRLIWSSVAWTWTSDVLVWQTNIWNSGQNSNRTASILNFIGAFINVHFTLMIPMTWSNIIYMHTLLIPCLMLYYFLLQVKNHSVENLKDVTKDSQC